MEDTSNIFRKKLPNQDVFYLAAAAQTLLLVRDTYGQE
jgi:hypothetical protein